MELVSEVLDAIPGVKRAVHVLVPALQYRQKNPESGVPVMALRSSSHNFQKIKMFQRIEFLGPSSLDPIFDKPLPGTNGRGVAILFTEFPIRVWYEKGNPPKAIESPEGANPDKILEEIIQSNAKVSF